MTLAQKSLSLELLNRDLHERERRAEQRRQDQIHDKQNAAHLEDWAKLLDRECAALRAVIALVEHYQPVDNSKAVTQRVEVAA